MKAVILNEINTLTNDLARVKASDRTAELNERLAQYREQVLAEFADEKATKAGALEIEIEALKRIYAKVVDAEKENETTV